MLSNKLIHLIESHEEEIAGCIVRSIHRHAELAHLSALPEADLRERSREILRNLGHWLAHSNEDRLAQEYEILGRIRFERSVPLAESVGGLLLFKEAILEFLDEQGREQDTLAWYAAEQFERRVGRLFDLLVIHLARGYEKAWRLYTAA